MSMKFYFAFLMTLFIFVVPALAQDQPPSVDEIVSRMQSKLNLTQDQVSAITPIIEKYSSQRDQLRQSVEDGAADRDSVRSQMKQLRESESQDLSQILSPDQMSQWQEFQKQGRHMHNSDENGGGNKGGNADGGNNGG